MDLTAICWRSTAVIRSNITAKLRQVLAVIKSREGSQVAVRLRARRGRGILQQRERALLLIFERQELRTRHAKNVRDLPKSVQHQFPPLIKVASM